jgi:hypothetical protein
MSGRGQQKRPRSPSPPQDQRVPDVIGTNVRTASLANSRRIGSTGAGETNSVISRQKEQIAEFERAYQEAPSNLATQIVNAQHRYNEFFKLKDLPAGDKARQLAEQQANDTIRGIYSGAVIGELSGRYKVAVGAGLFSGIFNDRSTYEAFIAANVNARTRASEQLSASNMPPRQRGDREYLG